MWTPGSLSSPAGIRLVRYLYRALCTPTAGSSERSFPRISNHVSLRPRSNCSIIADVAYIVLRGGYEGNSVVGPLQSPFPQAFSDRTDSYDYDSDSDLDDEDEDTTTTIKNSSPERSAKEASRVTFTHATLELTVWFVQDEKPQSSDDGSTSALGTGQTLLMRNCAYPT